MNFKDLMDEDLDLLFDPEEIGETVSFEGNQIVVVKSSETFRTKYKGKAEEMGIYTNGICVSIRKTDFPSGLAPNDRVEMDNESYEILDIEDLGNTYRIDIATNYR
ncbi:MULTISPECIES: head-tail joining protein [Psychrilyobacter]|uniref:Uncharacterized protein n=1 Tax=Psychrilyobacter piezotolerans TaxID=2293438 RepID=A0ABX9KJW2_9FUSO|nr:MULTISPECIES: hypothetical protein [Psychrilyobacter]MCS5421255.1 hypothetical protein [Psychrilyobacter sp. S5]NDI76988.1 hypothetical protein [Psychrilyobacter piezotolerans]RDE64605.1 hypothetical protein DV867_03430 [Psychrilyobacter sp. S5]REI42417.1 hypothetical protein DYH56_03430 [Psychrilyobacter piezotolerans]